MKLISTTIKQHKQEKYELYENIVLTKNYIDDKLTSCSVHYVGEKIKGIEGKPPYILIYVKESFVDAIKTQNPFYSGNVLKEHMIKPEDYKNIEEFDINRFYIYYSYAHLLFDHTGKVVSIPMNFDYIGSILNDRYSDIDKVYEHLKKDSRILSCEISDIPHYNADERNSKSVNIQVLLPQDEYEELFNKSQDYSSSIIELIIPPFWYNDQTEKMKEEFEKQYDHFGLKQFAKR